jgi:transcriptional regulator with XRE-family HTH domain
LLKKTGISQPLISRCEKGFENSKASTWQALAIFFGVSIEYLKGELTYDDLTPEGKKLCSDLVGRINDVINDELKYSELSSEENKRAIKLALQSSLTYYA